MLKSQFLKNNFIYLATTGLGGLLGYLFHFVVSHRLSVGEYGELQAIISFSIIFGVFLSAFSYFTIKNSAVFSLHEDRDGQFRFLNFVKKKLRQVILIFLIVFILLLPLIKNLMHLHDYLGITIAGLSIAVSFYAAIYSNSLQGWSDFKSLGTIGLAVVSMKLVSGYFLAQYFSNASAVTGSLLLSALTGWFIARKYFRKKWTPARGEESMPWRDKYFPGVSFQKSMFHILIFSIGLTVVSNADMVLVKSLASTEIAGYYAALSILGKAILAFNFTVASVLFPEACADGYSGKPAKQRSILGSYAIMILISLPVIGLYYFIPQFLVMHTFGSNYQPVASQLWLFGLMAFSLSFLTLESKLALARQDFRSSGLLLVTLAVLCLGIAHYHADIKEIILAVTGTFFLGWMMLLALNFSHRVNYATLEKQTHD